MTKHFPLLVLCISALASCTHMQASSATYTLSVEYLGSPVFGPQRVEMKDGSIPLGGTCQAGEQAILDLRLSDMGDGYFYYSCYTSCFIGVGGGRTETIAPGQSVTLECIEPELQVTLHEA